VLTAARREVARISASGGPGGVCRRPLGWLRTIDKVWGYLEGFSGYVRVVCSLCSIFTLYAAIKQ